MTLDETIDLVRRMHKEGVTRFSYNIETGAINVEFAPEFVVSPSTSTDTSKPFDSTLCAQCQKNPVGDMMPGACDQCALSAAGAR